MQSIEQAVTILRAGGLVAIPTETVYGLGADARNAAAVEKIFLAKQRPMDHPLIVHLSDMQQLSAWAREIPPEAKKLAAAFWPGPLTMIFKKAPGVLDSVTGGQDTVGIRMPKHPVAQALLTAFGGGIAAPSANRFGRISPTTSEAVREELGNAVDLILEGGQCEVGVESTIVDVSQGQPVILRPGMISAADIEAVLHQPVAAAEKKTLPRVSGSHDMHYAPVTKTQLMSASEIAQLTTQDLPFAVVGFTQQALGISVLMSNDPKRYAHDLYHVLRELDKKKLQRIIVETVPSGAEWDAVRDRLKRAAHSG